MTTTFKLSAANFTGKNGEQVPWLHVTEGKLPGAKWGKDANGKAVAGLSPALIVTLLETTGVSLSGEAKVMYDTAKQAIATAHAANNKSTASMPAPPPPPSVGDWFAFDGTQVLPGPIPQAKCIEIARSNPAAMFTRSGSDDWTNGTAEIRGLLTPVAPPMPSGPRLAETSDDDDMPAAPPARQVVPSGSSESAKERAERLKSRVLAG